MAQANPQGIGILGVTGYTGSELLRLLLQHPYARVTAVAARQSAGQTVGAALPAFAGVPQLAHLTIDDFGELGDRQATTPQAWRERGVDVVFACLPHGAFAARAPEFLAAGLRVVDLSADFRLAVPALYETFYHFAHPQPELLKNAVYGLCEWNDADLTAASLVANPGCYATAILLGLLPAVAAGWASAAPVVVTAISGVSGAGRGGKLAYQLAECGNSIAPYKVAQEHPHLAEMGQMLGRVGCDVPLLFNPHLAPMARGISATIAIPLQSAHTSDEAIALYQQRYDRRPFIQVLEGSDLPQTRFVRGSNRCDLAVRIAAAGRMLLVYCAIDNLIKGAAGQAVQNFNRMHGWADELGLPRWGIACA